MAKLHILTIALLLPFLVIVHTQAIEWDNSKFMALDEIKLGMKGKVKTVFSGTEVEEFNFEVLSIEKNAMPQFDFIWARGWGGTFDKTGVAGGMSGSPAYINGRLVGALSYTYTWQKKGDIFAITPIEYMVNVTKRGMSPNLSYTGSGEFTSFVGITDVAASQFSDSTHGDYNDITAINNSDRPFDVPIGFDQYPLEYSGLCSLLQNDERSESANGGEAPRSGRQFRTTNKSFLCWLRQHWTTNKSFERLDEIDGVIAKPLIPVTFSGFSARAMDSMRPLFEQYGMYPLQSSGGGAVDVNVPIEPGQVLGMEMARGDYTSFSYGTVTHIEGNQILGFGHSMFGEGHVNLPLSVGYVHYMLPSIVRSEKIAAPTRPIGTLVQDRNTALAGVIGPVPSYIPVHLRLKTADGITKELRYEVIRHRNFSAGMAMSGVWDLINAIDKASGDYTANIHTVIGLRDYPDIKKDYFYSSGGGPGSAAYSLSPLSSIIRNTYSKIDVDNISIDVSVEDKRNVAQIERVHISKNRYKPGDEVPIWITLRPYLEKPIIQKASITIPKDTPNGLTMLMVSSVPYNESWQRSRAPLNFQPRNARQLLRILQRGETSNHIILELYIPKKGMTVRGQELPALPLSMLSVMNTPTQTGESGLTRGTTLQQKKIQMKYLISGSSMLRLIIDRNAP